MNKQHDQTYPPAEEHLNIATHAFGFALAVIALLFLLYTTWQTTLLEQISAAVFGLSLISLYAASTLYHAAKSPRVRARLRVVDHAAIYILIAGTYTPFALLVLTGWVGWTIFGVSWGLAAIGITLKLFYTGKYDLLSTLVYVFMGWIIIFAIKPLMQQLSAQGMVWLVAGGAAYTIGAILYCIEKLPLNHAIFHLFVLFGSVCHFISVYFFVL